jgi:hypothetical protein
LREAREVGGLQLALAPERLEDAHGDRLAAHAQTLSSSRQTKPADMLRAWPRPR